MQRCAGRPRQDWENIILTDGLVYSPTRKPNGTIMQYWKESAFYSVPLDEVLMLERAAVEIFDMFIAAGDHIVEHPEIMIKMGIPEYAWPQVIKTWNDEPACQSVYGRYDIRFGGLDHDDPAMRVPKVYEFNADTPTCLLESAWVQWNWLEHTGQGTDQWNSMLERLTQAWTRNLGLIEQRLGHKPLVHFACSSEEESGEDVLNTWYLRDACEDAGYQTKGIFMESIELRDDGRFYDDDGDHLDVIFKLYPWEYMVNEPYGEACFRDMDNIGLRDESGAYSGGTVWIEPPYKMLWSNKGVLAVLWELYGDTELAKYLIPTWFEGEQPAELTDYVRKPLLGREGANVVIYRGGEATLEVPGDYGEEGFVVQEFAPLPEFPDPAGDTTVHPVLGIWMIDGDPAGLAIRESEGFVTDNLSFFVPHSIPDNDVATFTEQEPVRRYEPPVPAGISRVTVATFR